MTQQTQELILAGHARLLLPHRAIFFDSLRALLVSDLHLGKAETFQRQGLPIPRQVNHATLGRLQALCDTYRPQSLWVLGDLFHSVAAHGDGMLQEWQPFLVGAGARAEVVLGNHDRPLARRRSQLPGTYHPQAVVVENLCLSHTPPTQSDQPTLCGHIHPCLRLGGRGDRLRLPCFHWQPQENCLTLPAFGEFTGGHPIDLAAAEVAYVVAEEAVGAVAGPPKGRGPQGRRKP